MKKCPFCAEEIQDEAIKCRYCNEFLDSRRKWYFSTSTLVISLLCVGPFALPLLWFNPRYSKQVKIVVSIITVIITYLLYQVYVQAMAQLDETMRQLDGIL